MCVCCFVLLNRCWGFAGPGLKPGITRSTPTTLTMSLVTPGPPYSICERTQQLPRRTGQVQACSGSLGRVSNDSKVSLVVTPESKRLSIIRHQNIYQTQTTVPSPSPLDITSTGLKSNIYETSLISFPRPRCIGCRISFRYII